MAVATSTQVFRKEMADWLESRMDSATMAFGSGGINQAREVVSPDPAQTDLADPRGEYPLQGFIRVDDLTVRVTGRIDKGALVGVEISEAGLKIDGSLYAIRNFAAKAFEEDEYYTVNIDIKF